MKSFVRRYHSEILAEWKALARKLPVAGELSPAALADHVPELLDEIAEIAEEIAADAGPVQRTAETARQHALHRLAEGFDITLVVRELSLLRGAAMSVLSRVGSECSVAEVRALDLAIDHALTTSISRYAEAHQRILTGIDRISTLAFASRDLDDLLQRLLEVFLETTPSVDTTAIMLIEADGRLHLRAAVGLGDEVERGFSLAIGEGFAGAIAERREPMMLRSAYTDPLVPSEAIRKRGVRALYGVPLHYNGQVIGVVFMGSVTATEFSRDDCHFFVSLASRATVGIAQQMLRQELAGVAHAKDRALAKLESLLRASPAGIAFLDRDLRYLRVNEALAALNGVSVEQHIGRTVGDVLPAAASYIEPMLRQVLDSGQPIRNMEVPEPAVDDAGSARTFLINYFPVPDPTGAIVGVGGIILDVSDAKRTHEELRNEQQRIQSIIDHSPAAIWIKDASGKIVLANRVLAEALGHGETGVVGNKSGDVLALEVATQHEAHDRLVLEEQRAIQVEESVPSPTGTRTFLSIKFPIPGTPPLVGGIATDITERKRIEDELQGAVRLRDDLLAVVSHDLRSPLGAVQLGASMVLGQVGNDARARKHLEMIQRAVSRMENLIDDLMDSANIRVGRLQLELHAERAEAVLDEAIDIHQPLAEEKGLRLERHNNLADLQVRCDRDRILQVFGNLLGNALKFCRAGDTITVRGTPAGDSVRFDVTDTGPGIDPAVQTKLFDPYWSGTQRASGGAGLGLYISKGIVEGHGGRIWVESVPGHGATFSFTLPIAR